MQDGTPIIIKKVKKHGHGHHGGAWKVAYADFVTAMMAFFMVMWILGMSEDQKREIAAYFKDPIGVYNGSTNMRPPVLPDNPPDRFSQAGTPTLDSNRQSDVQKAEEVKEQVEREIDQNAELKDLKAKGDVTVKQTDEGVVIEMIENETDGEVFFELGSAVVRPKARALFASLAPILAKSGRAMYIDGHTDSRPMSGSVDNWDLSSQRANAVRRLLMMGGVTQSQILEVRGKADKEPRVPGDPYHFSNRRVTIVMPYTYKKQPTIGLPLDPSGPDSSALMRAPKDVVPTYGDMVGPKPSGGGAN